MQLTDQERADLREAAEEAAKASVPSGKRIVAAAAINITIHALIGVAVVFVLVDLLAGVDLSWDDLLAFGLLAAWIKGI